MVTGLASTPNSPMEAEPSCPGPSGPASEPNSPADVVPASSAGVAQASMCFLNSSVGEMAREADGAAEGVAEVEGLSLIHI